MTAEQIAGALARRCGVCGAPAGEPCRYTIEPGKPLPGRDFHHYRITNSKEKL